MDYLGQSHRTEFAFGYSSQGVMLNVDKRATNRFRDSLLCPFCHLTSAKL